MKPMRFISVFRFRSSSVGVHGAAGALAGTVGLETSVGELP